MYKILCLSEGEYVHGIYNESKDYLIKALNNPTNRFYKSSVLKRIMPTTCDATLRLLGGEIPKYLLEVVEVE